MHIGSLEKSSTPDCLDTLLWHLHAIWVGVFDRFTELDRTVTEARTRDRCADIGFSGGYKRRNPDATNKEVSLYVLRQWFAISKSLELPLVDALGNDACGLSF